MLDSRTVECSRNAQPERENSQNPVRKTWAELDAEFVEEWVEPTTVDNKAWVDFHYSLTFDVLREYEYDILNENTRLKIESFVAGRFEEAKRNGIDLTPVCGLRVTGARVEILLTTAVLHWETEFTRSPQFEHAPYGGHRFQPLGMLPGTDIYFLPDDGPGVLLRYGNNPTDYVVYNLGSGPEGSPDQVGYRAAYDSAIASLRLLWAS